MALSDADRRTVAVQVLKQIPVLWIWDNVEPVAGFPAGTTSAWSAAEQKELKDFLSACRDTQAKVLLTSRRDEQAWLGDLAVRIHVPPMPMQERVQLARALAEKHNRRLTEVEDWRPLLRFTQGNPLTITVLVGQALREGLKTKAQIMAFVEKLRAGEASFSDEVSEGRAKSLGASLSYGFEHAFNETERKQLALLHFFQGFVGVHVLCWMGEPEQGYWLPEVRGLTSEVGSALLDRAAEVGLLTAHRHGYYSIHPALPWYFKNLFYQYYPANSIQQASRAFVTAVGSVGHSFGQLYQEGKQDVISLLIAEEGNLLRARHLARQHEWWDSVIEIMQGLHDLYAHTGRRVEWRRLVEEIVSDFIDPVTDGPLPGREENWGLITDYRVKLAREARQWNEAERLQRVDVEWDRKRAATVLTLPTATLDDSQRRAIRSLAISLERWGHIQREQDKPDCVATYKEAISLCQHINDKSEEANLADNLGLAYLELPTVRDLAQAEHWFRHSLELRNEGDRLRRARTLGSLGIVALNRFAEAGGGLFATLAAKLGIDNSSIEASNAKQPQTEMLRHINAAMEFCQQALDLLPENAVHDLAMIHGQLGGIYGEAGDLDSALLHWRESIGYHELEGDLYHAGAIRYNVALSLWMAQRRLSDWRDAAEYARAALQNFETYGQAAAAKIQETKELLEWIERALATK